MACLCFQFSVLTDKAADISNKLISNNIVQWVLSIGVL